MATETSAASALPPARTGPRAVAASRCTKRRHPQFAASTCCRSRVVSHVVRVSVSRGSRACSRTRAGAGGEWIGTYIVPPGLSEGPENTTMCLRPFGVAPSQSGTLCGVTGWLVLNLNIVLYVRDVNCGTSDTYH